MSLKFRFTLILGILALGLAGALMAVHWLERRVASQSLADERQNRELLLNHWLDLSSRTLPQAASEYADELGLATSDRSAESILREKISHDLVRSGVQAVWLLGPKGAPLAQIARGGDPGPPPLAGSDFISLVAQTPSPRFFTETDRSATLLEVCVRRVPTLGRVSASDSNWLIATRTWDQAQLDTLAALTGATASLMAWGTPVASSTPTTLVLVRPLMDWHGYPLRALQLIYQAPELQHLQQTNLWQISIFIVFGALVLVAMWLALQAWVLRPLGLISASLKRADRAVITPLRAEPGEMGAVAQLVATSFDQREALQREIDERTRAEEALRKSEVDLRRTMDERTRLGRDLHDGVIQSLYAAGMGLSSIRSQLNLDQSEAAARLEQTRAALNETIHDLRNFINGLEPESLKMQSFTQAVTALLEVMQGLRPLQTAVSVDETLAFQLTLAQRVHALQIAREAVSNALRHGQATRVTIALRPTGENVEFEVTDNGRGFDPANLPAQGHGLENFQERAHELGGLLTVHSLPGQGTRVRLVFALLKTL